MSTRSPNDPNNVSDDEVLAPAATMAAEPAELKANADMCLYCFDVLVEELKKSNRSLTSNFRNFRHASSSGISSTPSFVESLPDESIECPLFVTWEKRNSRNGSFDLRGCIGTLSPKPLISSIGEYAIMSALRDKRFQPVALEELPSLRVGVSLLVQYEECKNCHDWSVGVHGIIIKFYQGDADTSRARGIELSATFLPEVAEQQGWDQQKTVQSLVLKAGYKGAITKGLLQKIRCTRYQSSKFKLSFEEYVQHHGHTDPNNAKSFIISDGSDTESNGSQSNCQLM